MKIWTSDRSYVECADLESVIAYLRPHGRGYWQRYRLVMEHGRRFDFDWICSGYRARILEALNQWEPFRHRADYGRSVRAWRARVDAAFRDDPGATLETRSGRWQTREQWRAECAAALDARINATVRPEFAGRRECPEYQHRLRRDARAVRERLTRRLIVRQFETPEARSRFPHLLDVA